MAMFYKNICRFGQCNLEFADLYDLIQHIEETHIPMDGDKKPDPQPQVACAPLSAICRYFQKLPDQPARPIIPEPTFQQPSSNIPSGAHAAAAMVAAVAAASVKKRLPSIIAQSSSTSPSAGGSLMSSGGQSIPQTPVTPTSSILFHPPANVAARSSGATPASHISDGDDESMNDGRESLSSDSSMVVDDGANESGVFYKMISPTGSSDERRFMCTAPGCKKSYKNMNGIRYHIKIAHVTGAAEAQPNAKKFRCQCGKAYKTSHGLHNHMLQTHHRQAPQSSTATVPTAGMGSMNSSGGGGGTKYPSGMAGVSASASQFKRGLPPSLMSSGGGGPQGPKQPHGPPSSLNQGYYPSQSAMKSGGAGGNSSTTTLPSGVSVQVSNLGGGTPTTVQVGQQGALGIAAGSSGTGGPMGPTAASAHGLHISAGRRLSTAPHHLPQQHLHSMGGRPLKIHSAGSSGGIQGVVVSAPPTPAGVSAYNSNISNAPTTVTTMGGGNDYSDS